MQNWHSRTFHKTEFISKILYKINGGSDTYHNWKLNYVSTDFINVVIINKKNK
jgi:hypothetical protein